jgi:hypothetical protein
MQRDHACRSSRLWANFLADSFFRLPYCMIETIDLQSSTFDLVRLRAVLLLKQIAECIARKDLFTSAAFVQR